MKRRRVPELLIGPDLPTKIAAEILAGDWAGTLGEEPADGRVLWSIGDGVVTLYWRPGSEQQG